MNTGMLWFDNDPRTSLDKKIEQAVLYYRRKYERMPELCLINTAARSENPQVDCVVVDGQTIAVRSWIGAARHHFWLGIEERPDSSKEKTS